MRQICAERKKKAEGMYHFRIIPKFREGQCAWFRRVIQELHLRPDVCSERFVICSDTNEKPLLDCDHTSSYD